MNEFDTRAFDQLDAFTPDPGRWPDWQDVLRRARKRHTRRIVVAIAAALAVLGSAAAVTAALGGFDAWLSGSPGKPAPKAEQERFQATNERSLAAFPKDTKLRELIRTEQDGKTYVLFGFRSGRSLCLRLKAVTLGHSIGPVCAPVSKIVHATAPILVVVGNDGFSDEHARPSAAVSFGIAADGVAHVDVHAVDGTHRAVLGGNAYLWVENEPNTGQRVSSITAVGPDRGRLTVPISTSFGFFAVDASPPRRPRGPSRVQVKIPNPTVGWYIRGEKRGYSLGEVRRKLGWSAAQTRDLGSTRFVKPDPQSNVLVGLTGMWCLIVFQSGPSEGCTPGREFWARGPLNILMTSEGDEFVRVSGVAADGVERVVVFLADGVRQAAALRDNLFTTLVAVDEFPARIVAYDRRNRVVGVQTPLWSVRGQVPAASRRLHRVSRVTGSNGVVAVERVGALTRGYRCWRVDLSTGQSPGGCLPPIGSGPAIWVDLVQPAGKDIFVIGHSLWPIVRVQIEFPNGDTVSTRPVSGLFVLAVPRGHLRPDRQTAFVRGYTSEGLRIQRQGIVFKAKP